jgi:hypothetical protein
VFLVRNFGNPTAQARPGRRATIHSLAGGIPLPIAPHSHESHELARRRDWWMWRLPIERTREPPLWYKKVLNFYDGVNLL